MAAAAFPLAIFLLSSWWAQGRGEPGLAILAAESVDWSAKLCAVYNTAWGSVPSDNRPRSWLPAEAASDGVACSPQNLSQVGGAVVSLRGNCSFCEKAENVELAGGRLLVVVYNGSDLWVEPVCESGDHTPSIPVLLVSNSSGWQILHFLANSTLSLGPYRPPTPTFDPSAIVTLVVAVVTVVLGSYISNSPFQFMKYGLLVRQGESYGVSEARPREKGVKAVAMTLVSILAFLALICVTLLLLYFFYYPMVYLVIGVFCVGAAVGLFSLFSPFVALVPFCKNFRLPENKLPVLEFRPDPRFPITLLLCLAISLWWLAERHSDYGWVLQNVLGFAFLVHIMKRMLFLPTWVVAVAMILLFFYDIFMVFITPFLTKDHQSVMVKAATGPGGHTAEPLPVVFIVPKLLSSQLLQSCPVSLTGSLPYSLLGYGDVGVPGLLVALCLQFDRASSPASWLRPYFLASSLAYILGLCLTYTALFLMKTAQPALLYLVPTTLGSVALLALCQKEFRLFFTGQGAGKNERRAEAKTRSCVHTNCPVAESDTECASDQAEKETLIDRHSSS